MAIGRVAVGSRRGFHDHIADPELAQNTLGPFGQRRIAFGRGYPRRQAGNQRRDISGRAAHHQDLVGIPDLGCL